MSPQLLGNVRVNQKILGSQNSSINVYLLLKRNHKAKYNLITLPRYDRNY